MPDIVYEDNHVIVAVKPPNLLSQADDTGDPDLLGELKEYIRVKYAKPGAVYLGLVHRLDRPVGGLMVFARTRPTPPGGNTCASARGKPRTASPAPTGC